MNSFTAYLKQNDNGLKILLWAIYLCALIGFVNYQYLFLIDVYNSLGVNTITLICFVVILCLLPYSLGNKLKIDVHWYALAFAPSILIVTILANERITVTNIIVALIMLSAVVFIALKKIKLRCAAFVSNLIIMILLLCYCFLFSNTNDLCHYKHQISRNIQLQEYDKALEIGKQSLSIDSAVFQLRVKAMLETKTLGDKLFAYPIPENGANISINAEETENYYDILLCNLLLNKKLYEFSMLVSKYYDISSPELPLYYKEALTIFMSQSISANIKFKDTASANKYKEFLATKGSTKDRIASNNLCRDQYSDSYFWYYYFFPLNSSSNAK